MAGAVKQNPDFDKKLSQKRISAPSNSKDMSMACVDEDVETDAVAAAGIDAANRRRQSFAAAGAKSLLLNLHSLIMTTRAADENLPDTCKLSHDSDSNMA
jgi:hypothetical protein